MSQSLLLKKHEGFYSVPLFEKWQARVFFTTRTYDMGFKDKEGNGACLPRKKAYEGMDIHWKNLVCPSQVHSSNVYLVRGVHKGRGVYSRVSAIPETDALITAQRHVPLAVLTADCLPVFILDISRRVIGLVHAGWRGVRQDILANTLRLMKRNFKTGPCDLVAVLGPSIQACCYEVGKEFLGYFPHSVQKRGKRIFFDIKQEGRQQLEAAGVKSDRIYDSRLCTCCLKDEFFSYRREGVAAGRSMAVMELA
jgi:YfiH family protein